MIVESAVKYADARIYFEKPQRFVRAAAVDDHDVLCPGELSQSAPDIRALVVGQHDGGDGIKHGGDCAQMSCPSTETNLAVATRCSTKVASRTNSAFAIAISLACTSLR